MSPLLSETPSRGELRDYASMLRQCSADPSWIPPVEKIQESFNSISTVLESGSNRDKIAAGHLVLELVNAWNRHVAIVRELDVGK